MHEQWNDTDACRFLDYRQMAIEYACLSTAPNPSEEELDRLQQILDLATEDGLLDFWIHEIDHIVMHRSTLLTEDVLGHYADIAARLREYLEARPEESYLVNNQVNCI